MGNILSIDWGTKYLGTAYRNERGGNITPVGSLYNDESLFFSIADILQRYHITKVIIGYPKNHEDLKKAIDIFIEQISFIDNELEIEKVDEEYSSVQAGAISGNFEKTTEEDTIASMTILQEYIDKNNISSTKK